MYHLASSQAPLIRARRLIGLHWARLLTGVFLSGLLLVVLLSSSGVFQNGSQRCKTRYSMLSGGGRNAYVNETLRFSITFLDSYQGKAGSDYFVLRRLPDQGGGVLELYISETRQQSIEDIVAARRLPEEVSGFRFWDESQVLLDGIKAIRYKWRGGGTGEAAEFIQGGCLISVTYYPGSSGESNMLDEILLELRGL